MNQDEKIDKLYEAMVGNLERPGLLSKVENLVAAQQESNEDTVRFHKALTERFDKLEVVVTGHTQQIGSLEKFKVKMLGLAGGMGIAAGGGASWISKLFGGGNGQ